MSEEPLRLSKLMADRGICSRREADDYISRGLVFVDGQRIDVLGTKVLPSQTISLASEAKRQQQSRATVLLNKPIGYVSGQPEKGYLPAITLITPENRWTEAPGPKFQITHLKGLAPAGRLDIDSKGLLVFTQDGVLARRLTGEEERLDKEYLVRVQGQLDDAGLSRLRYGLELDGKKLQRADVDWLNTDQLRFILREGRKRQIRRMCEAVGLKVVGLKRVRIGKLKLGKLPEGKWRYLADDETF